ncbi:MAG: CHAT domain-containing tetratricopeptide repeat protein [Thermodesulfobacteriota bacterium]
MGPKPFGLKGLILAALIGQAFLLSTPAKCQQDPLEKAASLNQKALHLYQAGRYREAIKPAAEALALAEKTLGPEAPVIAALLNNLAINHEALGELDQAAVLFKRALVINEKTLGPDDPETATNLNNLAECHRRLSRYSQAEPLYERAIAILEKAAEPDQAYLASILNNLAELYRQQGHQTRAEPLYKRSLVIKEKILGPDHPSTATSLNNLAELYRLMGAYDLAEPLYKRALNIRENKLGRDNPLTATTASNLGLLYHDLGEYDQAEQLFKRALDVFDRTGPDLVEAANPINNLALLYSTLGLHAQAEALYKRTLALKEKALGPEHPDVATVLNNLAELYRLMGAYDKALILFERALTIREKVLGARHQEVANSLNSLAVIFCLKGDYDQAEQLHQRALAILEKTVGPRHPEVAVNLHNLADIYRLRGKAIPAEQAYNQALSILEKSLGPDHLQVANTLNNLAGLYAALDRPEKAHAIHRRAQDIDSKLIDQVLGFTSEEQKLQFLVARKAELEISLALAVESSRNNASARRDALDWWLRRKGIILEAQRRFQEALVYSDDPEAVQTFEELARVRSRLSRLSFSGPGQEAPESYRHKMEVLMADKERIESKLSRLSQVYALQQQKRRADAGQVAQKLPPGTVLLEMARVRYYNFKANAKQRKWRPAHYLAFILPAGQGGQVGLVDLGEADIIDQAISVFRKAVNDTNDLKGVGASAAGRKLYDLIFHPVQKELGPAKEIFISPDGNLNLIPFEILQAPNERYLIEDYTFNYLASGRDILGFGRPRRQAGPALLLGNPNFNLGSKERDQMRQRLGLKSGREDFTVRRSPGMRNLHFDPLPGTKKEVETIKEVLGTRTAKAYTGDQAIEELLISAQSPRFIHLATHGFFLDDQDYQADVEDRAWGGERQMEQGRPFPKTRLDNPLLRSGLALAGANTALASDDREQDHGLFTAEKVLGLKLRGVELVVLSACDTGVGEVRAGEGVYGLRRAFMQAGIQGLIMSLWSVPDQETQELMIEFYRNLVEKRMTRRQALRQASLKQMDITRKRYGAANPLFWGAFVYLGEP